MKKYSLRIILAVIFIFFLSEVNAQYSGTITTVAGGSCYGSYAGDGTSATATSACFNYIGGIAVNRAGDLFIADQLNYRIRKVNRATGVVTTIAGNGASGYSGDGGPGPVAKIGRVVNICGDNQGNCYFLDPDNQRIRKVDYSTGIITTIAGNGTSGYSGNGGAATSAQIGSVSGIFSDTSGNIFFADGSTIRKITASTNTIDLYAGSTTYGSGYSGDGGPATSALIGAIYSVSGDEFGNIYISDGFSVRRIDNSGIISTVAGTGSTLIDACPATATSLSAQNLGVDSIGNIYIFSRDIIRKVTVSTGIINNIGAGIHHSYYSDSRGKMCVDRYGNIYQSNDTCVKKLSGATSGITVLSVQDTITSAPCTLPKTKAIKLHGTIPGIPSATDSVDVVIDFGDYYYNSSRHYRLPYYYSSGIYGFGLSAGYFSNYSYPIPGIYTPRATITTLGGYTTTYDLFQDTARGNCSSMLSSFPSFSLNASVLTAPCIFPAYARNIVSGNTVDTPSATDSVYIVYTFDDSAAAYKVVPYVFTGTTYTFSDTATHEYYSNGSHVIIVYAVSSSGINTIGTGGSVVTMGMCGPGSIVDSIVYDHSSSSCSVPDTVTYHYSGIALDSAALSPSVNLHVNYGDGSSDNITAPIHNDGYGNYIFDGYFTHIFTIPGVYASYHNDTVGMYTFSDHIFYGGSTSDSLIVGSGCSPVSGVFYIDSNSNCIRDAGDAVLSYWSYALVNNTTGDTTYGWCNDTGAYTVSVIAGYTYTLVSNPTVSAGATLTPSCPTTGIYTITATSGTTYTHDFAFTCHTPATMDMSVSGWGWGFIPGDTGVVGIWSSNAWGFMCDTLSADVTIVLDTNLAYRGMWSGPAPTRISGDTLIWHFATSGSLFDFNGYVKVTTDTTATIFDTIRNRLFVTPTRIADPVLTNNSYAWQEPVVSSWDPNEKQVSPQGFGTQGYIPNGTPLSYIIHFQNTGNAPARNITISDTISGHLDLATLQVIGSSAPVLVYQFGNVIKFRFNNINLPDSTSDYTGSMGYIAYNIEPFDSLSPGTTITNMAGIYFDYNSAVYTNSTLNTIEDTIGHIWGADSVCAGSAITLTNHISGGVWSASNGHATVSSSGIVSGVTPGLDTITYTVYGHQTASKVIFVGASAGSISISGATTVCEGSSITLTPSLSGGSWVTSAATTASVSGGMVTGIAAGTATITYTIVNSCGTATATHAITVNPLPGAGTISGADSICIGDTATMHNAITTGAWSSSNTSVATINTTGMVTAMATGTTSISYTATNTCGAANATHALTVRSAIDCPTEVKQVTTQAADVSIFPNPNTGKFTISLPAHENDVNIQIIDVHGRVVKVMKVTDKQTEISIDLTHVASGVYMIKAEADGTTYYRKVVVTD